MRATAVLTVFWTLLSLALGSPLVQPGIQHLDIATPERVAKATGIVNKRYQEEADRIAGDLSQKQDATNPRNMTKDIMYCGQPQVHVDKKKFDVAHEVFKDWCDSDLGEVRPFSHHFLDFDDVRIALCNWGLWNSCNGAELDNAWDSLNLICPPSADGGDESAGGETVAAGMWYKGAWLKGYFRSNCTTGDLCSGDRTGIPCWNED